MFSNTSDDTSPRYGADTLTWRRVTDKDHTRRATWTAHAIVVAGALAAVASAFSLHIYSLSVASVGLALFFLPYYLRTTPRLVTHPDHVALKRQRPWRNTWVWLSFAIDVTGIALVVESTTGEIDPRPGSSGLLFWCSDRWRLCRRTNCAARSRLMR
jgi:hypothetical protein